MRLPIDVVYDSDASTVEVTSSLTQKAEVYVYNAKGSIVGLSQTLNASISLANNGPITIHIIGDGWYAIGNVNF